MARSKGARRQFRRDINIYGTILSRIRVQGFGFRVQDKG
jgi:hypothetical protein